MVRKAATLLALNRIAMGTGYVAMPQRGARAWSGRGARDERAQIMIRGLGARDVALGTGALRALLGAGAAGSPRPWLAAQAIADLVDLGATLAARERLPRAAAAFALAMAAGSAAIAAAGAATLEGPE